MKLAPALTLGLLAVLSTSAIAKTEKEFLGDAIKGDNSEVALGSLAASKGGSEPVKTFGQTLVSDHSKAKTQATALAAKLGVSPSGEISSEAEKEMVKLQRLNGRDFDEEFARYMVKDHEKDIAEFKAEAAKGHGPAQQLASQSLPTLEKHLEMAKSLEPTK